MHMIFRTMLAFLRKKFLKKACLNEMTEITMRVWPTDLDILMHVNNGVYFSMMDFGRWDAIFRNGVYDACYKKGWYAVVAGQTIKFRRSLELWNKFTLQTQITGHDEKNFFIQQKFIYKGEIMSIGLVKVRFLKRSGGTISPKEVFESLNMYFENKNPHLGEDWSAIESKYLV